MKFVSLFCFNMTPLVVKIENFVNLAGVKKKMTNSTSADDLNKIEA